MSTYSPIASQTLSANAASVIFNGIPQGYTDLIIVVKGQGTSNIAITTTFNNDTATNYSRAYFYADGNGQASGRLQNESGIIFSFNAARGHTIMHINGYSNSVGFKNALISNDYYDNAVVRTSGVWRNTAPITSIKFSGSDIASGTVISLYGLAGGQVSAKASGGVITTSGAYTIHTFLQSGGFIPNENLTVDYLVVAGGGGGGGFGGGGGAGGLRTTTSVSGLSGGGGSLETALSLTAGVTYPAIVGAGGAGGNGSTYTAGSNGVNSVFATITSIGGGGGGAQLATALSGGSGGGSSSTFFPYGVAGAAGTANQGFAGGQAFTSGGGGGVAPAYSSGAGGGAGAVGGSGTSSTSVNASGGAGVATSISGSSVTYAIGGNAGGVGASQNAGTNANANTGGGGGGLGNVATTGGNAGSGIVIVRYLT
jgi:hypothetical protein